MLSPDRGSLGELALGGRQLVETGWVAGIESQPLEGRVAVEREPGKPRVVGRLSSLVMKQCGLDESLDPPESCVREERVDAGQPAESGGDGQRLCHQAIERQVHESTVVPMCDGLHDMEQPQLQGLLDGHAVAGGERRCHLERMAVDVNGLELIGHARRSPLPEG